jgi:actin-related protein 8
MSALSNLQESLGASFGAGLSTACVVDVGATRTSVACVEDGMVLPETRLVLYSIKVHTLGSC